MNICAHTYVGRYRNRPPSMGERCPYVQFYDGIRSQDLPPTAQGNTILPVDDHGICIFHSQEPDWKRRNDFAGKFLQLVQLLDVHNAERHYDFTEFVFLGSDLRTKAGLQETILRITDIPFRKQAYFTAASFLDPVELEGVDFQGGAAFDQAIFKRDLTFSNSSIRGLDFSGARFTDDVHFRTIKFLSYAFFADTTFETTKSSPLVFFKDSYFEGITDFSAADFRLGDQSAVSFQNTQFLDVTNFRNAHFNCQVEFSDVSFADTTEFIDTSFDRVSSTARYRGTALEFDRIEVTGDAVLSFISTDPQKRMFDHDVRMSFKADPSGTVRFENVNFNMFTADSKERLLQLAKLGKVEIGAGCIKYRFQTPVQTVSVSQGNAPLILELCQTFTNYFTASNGLNLGFEIVERDRTKVSFFYFTDEDISEETFLERLARTEESFWGLLAVGSEEQLLALGPTDKAFSEGRASAVIIAVDAVSALLGTFFRVGTRIRFGDWTEADTWALLKVIPFNLEVASSRAPRLHQLLVDRYTGGTLLDLSDQMNHQLFLEGQVAALTQTVKTLVDTLAAKGGKGDTIMGDKYEVSAKQARSIAVGKNAQAHHNTARQIANKNKSETEENHMQDKIKILFLAADPTDAGRLRLGEEVRQIKERLRIGSHRDSFDLIPEHAVRVTDLQRILLEHQPHIVHFSGHGNASEELVFEDSMGQSKRVEKKTLTALFDILKDNIRVVVLNACFSKGQAEALNEVIDYTIGMNKRVADKMAISFAGAFYQALAFDRTVTEAFKLAKLEPDLVGLEGSDTPEFFVRTGADLEKPLIASKKKRGW